MAFGMDPQVAKYFRRIMRSLFAGLMWLFINITAGIYYGLAFREGQKLIVNIMFYIWLVLSLLLLLWYLYKIWKTPMHFD